RSRPLATSSSRIRWRSSSRMPPFIPDERGPARSAVATVPVSACYGRILSSGHPFRSARRRASRGSPGRTRRRPARWTPRRGHRRWGAPRPAVKLGLQESTWVSYARYLRLHVIPRIGSVQLQALDPAHLNRLYGELPGVEDRKSTRLNSSHANISYAVFCLKK